jgi:hypothetical protein
MEHFLIKVVTLEFLWFEIMSWTEGFLILKKEEVVFY